MPNVRTKKNRNQAGNKRSDAPNANSSGQSSGGVKGAGKHRRKQLYRARRNAKKFTHTDTPAAASAPVSTGVGMSGQRTIKRKGRAGVLVLPQHGQINFIDPSPITSATISNVSLVPGTEHNREDASETSTSSSATIQSPFNKPNILRDFAVGIYKRARRCRLVLATQEQNAYDISTIQIADTPDEAINAIAIYLNEVYLTMRKSVEAIPVCPRNIAFILRYIGNKRYDLEGQIRRYENIDFGSLPPITDQQRTAIATLFRNERLGYQLVTVPPRHCKPFTSTFRSGVGKNAAHKFVIYDYDVLGSSMSYFGETANGYLYVAANGISVATHTWPLLATCAIDFGMPASADGNTCNTIAIHPGILRQYVAYEDMLFDAKYIFATSNGDPRQDLNLYKDEIQDMLKMWPNTSDFNDLFTPAFIASIQDVIEFSRSVYAPFLHIGDSKDLGDWQSYSLCAAFRGPLYLPGPVHESIVANTSCTTLSIVHSSRQSPGGLWRGMIFHIPNAANNKYTSALVDTYIKTSQVLLRSRFFLKVNHVPESQPSQAVIPHFFMNALLKANDSYSVYTPYSYEYCEHHNLTALANALWWPVLAQTTDAILASMALLNRNSKSGSDTAALSMADIMFDYSFQQDSSEIDHYLKMVRINYLGLFGFVSGLLGVAAKGITTAVKTIARPILSNPVVQKVVKVTGTALGGPVVGKLIDAGLSLVSTSPPGDPATENTTDLSAGQ